MLLSKSLLKKRNTIDVKYILHNHQLESVESSKYLEMTTSKDLKCDINTVTAKANHTLGFLRRNMTGCKTSAKPRAYETLVRPTLEYGAAVLDTHTTGQVKQVDQVQRRAARFATKNYYDRTLVA